MKRFKLVSLLIAVCLFVSTAPITHVKASIEDFTIDKSQNRTAGGFQYIITEDNKAAILSYYGEEKNVVVPDSIDGIRVTSILPYCFQSEEIDTVILPEGLEIIEANAFYNCKRLAKIIFPKGLKKIETNGFNTDTLKTVICYQGSVGEAYGLNNKIDITYIGPYFKVSSAALSPGESKSLTVENAKGTTQWNSDNPEIAEVSADGIVTGVKKGSTFVTAVNDGWTIHYNIEVKEITLNKKKVTITEGKKATLKLSSAVGKITWRSSNAKIASVSDKGVVTGLKTGAAVITGKVNGKSFTSKVTVKANTKKLADFSLKYEDYPGDRANILYSKLYYKGKSLAVDTYIFNNTGFKLMKIDKITIKIYLSGKEIGQQTFTDINLNMEPHSSKKIVVVVDNKNISKKNMDLRVQDLKVGSSGGTVSWGTK